MLIEEATGDEASLPNFDSPAKNKTSMTINTNNQSTKRDFVQLKTRFPLDATAKPSHQKQCDIGLVF